MREIIIISVLSILCTNVFAQSISITEISPDSPATLAFGKQVTVTFDYEFNEPNGVRIFARPFTSGNLTPNYATSGSPVYKHSGQGSINFTIQSGNVTVDQLRVRAVSAKNDLLFEFYLPVEFTFTPQPLTLFQSERLAITESVYARRAANRTDVVSSVDVDTASPDITPLPDCPDNNEIVEKTVKPDGTIELLYSDGSIVGILTAGEDGINRYRIDPVTSDTTYSSALFSQVQAAYPPGFIGTETAISEEWLNSLNTWIEHHGDRLLGRIDILLDDESYSGYLSYEENAGLSIYEKVNFRYTFLERLAE
ncbi:MAG: hypothetical protein WD735_04395 [Balneolaceae bacterium]